MKSISREGIIIGAVGLIFVVIIGVLIWKSPTFVQNTPAEVTNLSLLVKSDSHMTGSSTAKVTVVEFGDYECPACGATYPLLKQITDSYQNNPNFNFVFRNFPLSQHKYAKISAEAAEAAGAQGKYWEMHDRLYENQDTWVNSDDPLVIFTNYARDIGLNVEKFVADVKNNAYESRINADLADVTQLALDHTPTIFINGKEQVDFGSIQATIASQLGQ